MFKIGDFSKLSNVSIRMLRHYEKLGLLKPEQVDALSGFRYYSAGQIITVNRIRKLQSLGFSLAVIKEILGSESMDDISRYLRVREQELQTELDRITSQSNMLGSIREIVSEDENMLNYHVTLKQIPERYVMGLRAVVPGFSDECKLWSRLYREASRQRAELTADSISAAIYHDRDYHEENVDIEVQSVIKGRPGDHRNCQDAAFYLAPAAQVAAVTFQGGYQQMQQVTISIAEWIQDNQYVICGPLLNIFHVSPVQEQNSDNWITETCFQVRKKEEV